MMRKTKKGALAGTFFIMAGLTGLEPATSSVTGWHSNQLSYNPKTSSQFNYAVMSHNAAVCQAACSAIVKNVYAHSE